MPDQTLIFHSQPSEMRPVSSERYYLNESASLETRSPEVAAKATSKQWVSNKWHSAMGRSAFHARIRTLQGARVTVAVCDMSTGCGFTVLPDSRAAYLLCVGLDGLIEIRDGEGLARMSPRQLGLRLIQEGLALTAKGPARGVLAFIPVELVHRRAPAHLQLDQGGQLQTENSLAARLLAECLVSMAANSLGRFQQQDFKRSEELLLTLLRETMPNPPARAEADVESGSAWFVNVAEKHIESSIAEPISMQKLARVTGMSPRTLHEGFRKHRGYSPMKFLRVQRMMRVRQELSEPSDRTTVTDAALKWGFGHLGRFSSYYTQQFGEKPSTTLMRARLRMRIPHSPGLTARASGF